MNKIKNAFHRSCSNKKFIFGMIKLVFVTFVGSNFLGQMVSFGICLGVIFSRDKIHCLDPSKQPRALANL